MKRRRLVVGTSAAVLLVVGSAVAARDEGGGAAGETAGPSTADSTTEDVARRDLAEHAELGGTLGYGARREVVLVTAGTITALPALGTVIDRGQTVARVDGHPVPLLVGDQPLWRQLDADATDGVDVETIEANLVALGYATPASLTVDQDWTSATTSAVKRWQEALGRDQTGAVAPGDAIVLPSPVRVATQIATVGSPTEGPVLEVTGVSRLVTIDLDVTKQTLVDEDQAVEIVLPDQTTTTGTISSVGSVAEEGEDLDGDGLPDSSTVEVQVALDDPAAGGSLDQAPVTVRVVTTVVEAVLAVPVGALLVLADGSYVVERLGADGTVSQVPVESGAFADGWVEITGDLAEGDDVVVPE